MLFLFEMEFLTKATVTQVLERVEHLRRKLLYHDKDMLETLEELTVLLNTVLVLFRNDGEKLNISIELSEILNSIAEITIEEDFGAVLNNVFTKKSLESLSSDIKNTVIIPLLLTLHDRVKTTKFGGEDTFAVTINELKLEMIDAVVNASNESLATLPLTSQTNSKTIAAHSRAGPSNAAYSTSVEKLKVTQFVNQRFIEILDRYPNHDDLVYPQENEISLVEKKFPSTVFPIKASEFVNTLSTIYGL